jgi:homopolymeric O-antigen transport system ATP-binding protein
VVPVVSAHGLGKRFRHARVDRAWTFQEIFQRAGGGIVGGEAFWALRDVSFELEPGRMLGLLGRNGAGKTTLLRLVGGVGVPDEGDVEVRGRIGALLELGAGFHPELSGRENVWVGGVASGLLRREVRERFDAIVAFAELEAFIDDPLRTYSSGMQMRLAFAVATAAPADVLLVDEVLAVGDLPFRERCIGRIAELRAAGCAVILVSHDPEQIRALCDEALHLEGGAIVAKGAAGAVVESYLAALRSRS